MALMDSGTVKGVAIGLGVMAAAPIIASSLLGASRPLARATIKSGLILYEKGRETVSEFGEVFEDLVAEARSELDRGSETDQSASVVAAANAGVAEAVAEHDARQESPRQNGG